MDSTRETNDRAPRRTKRNTAIGVTAGLIGGGAIGLLMTVPSIGSAASDDSTPAPEPAVAALQDGSTDVERPEPGTRLRELLQVLVDDATITGDQADAVTRHLIENRPDRPDRGDHGRRHHRGRPGGAAFDGEVIAGLIGIDVEQLRAELGAGNSIAVIAEANGIDVATIVDALVAEVEAHLDQAVEDNRLTEDEAAERLGTAAGRIADRMDRTPPVRG